MSNHSNDPNVNYLNCAKGFMSWFWTLDAKRLGVMYMWSTLIMLMVGGAFALVIRAELFEAGAQMISKDMYNQLFTLHGAIMIFLVIIPSIPAALGNFVLPVQLGVKDVAFPKLNRFSYHLYVIGAIFLIMSIITGGIDTGWTFYAPYSIQSSAPILWALFGVFILGFSSIFTGLNFVATVHKMRPPGMTWFRMPLFLWAIYATAIIQVLATPVIGITVLALAVENMLNIGIFNPALGGDPVLFQHMFWFYSHPAVYIMILPGMGVISELFSTFSRKAIFGYRFIAYSSIAIAMVSFIVWGHHMFTSGQSQLVSVIFSAITFTVAIPSAIKVLNWVATMYKGSIRFQAPMLYAMSVIWLFGIGGLTGLWLATLVIDIHLHDTYFVVAHFHFVMVGSAIFSYFGGIHYWWPKMFGKMYNEKAAQIWAGVMFLGFNGAFLPQFVLGTRGMPRRYFDYVPEFEYLNQLSTYGAALIGVAMLGSLGNLMLSFRTGRKAPANPWGAVTLEWQCPSPIPPHNFETAPAVGDPYDLSQVTYKSEEEGWVPVNPDPEDPYLIKVN